MNKSKWGIIGLTAVAIASISGGITIFFSIASAISLKKYFLFPVTQMGNH